MAETEDGIESGIEGGNWERKQKKRETEREKRRRRNLLMKKNRKRSCRKVLRFLSAAQEREAIFTVIISVFAPAAAVASAGIAFRLVYFITASG